MRRFLCTVLIVLAVAPAAFAVQPDEMLADPKLEARARDISGHLRCLVCQNQSIDDSDADLARDLRLLVRDRLKAGDSNEQVIDFIVDRYGEFVLLKPRFEARTVVLWLAPFVLVIVGGIAIIINRRRQPRTLASETPLSEAEKTELERLTGDGNT